MSIRLRTESSRLGAGVLGGVGLAGAGAIHAVWAAGSTWPAASADQLADLVVGKRPMPGPLACAAVTVALAGAAAVTVHASAGQPGRLNDTSRTLASIAAGALFVRGLGGVLVEAASIGHPAPEFRRWNRRLYNPLCLTLAALVWVARSPR